MVLVKFAEFLPGELTNGANVSVRMRIFHSGDVCYSLQRYVFARTVVAKVFGCSVFLRILRYLCERICVYPNFLAQTALCSFQSWNAMVSPVMYRRPTGLKVTRAQMFLCSLPTPSPCPVTQPGKGLGVGYDLCLHSAVSTASLIPSLSTDTAEANSVRSHISKRSHVVGKTIDTSEP